MKKRELDKLRGKESKELEKQSLDKKLELAKLESKIKAGKEKNIKKAKNLKIEIAQIMTLIREKEIMESELKQTDNENERK